VGNEKSFENYFLSAHPPVLIDLLLFGSWILEKFVR